MPPTSRSPATTRPRPGSRSPPRWVIGVPNIAVSGEPVTLESRQDYSSSGARTSIASPSRSTRRWRKRRVDRRRRLWNLPSTPPPPPRGCPPRIGRQQRAATAPRPRAVSPYRRAARPLVADGVVGSKSRNSPDVDAFCSPNRHTVKSSITTDRRTGSISDSLFVGLSRSISVSSRIPERMFSCRVDCDPISRTFALRQPTLSIRRRVSPLTVTFMASRAATLTGRCGSPATDPDTRS